MKVYEIIAESKDLDEGWLDKLGATAFGAVAGKATRAASRQVARKAAEKAANAKALGQFGKLPTLAKAGVIGKVAGGGILKLAPWAIRIYTGFQIYGLFKNYNDTIEAWDKKLQADLAAGKITKEQYEAQMNYIRQTELGLLVPKVAAGIIGTTMTAGLFGGLGKVFKWSDNAAVKGLGHLISGLGTAGNAYMWSKINSPEGSEAVATLMTGTALGDWTTGIIGQTAAGAIDWFKGTSNDAAKVDAGKKPNGQGGSDTKVDKPTDEPLAANKGEERYSMPTNTPAQPAKAPEQPATAASKEYAPPGYTRDAKGNLIHTGD